MGNSFPFKRKRLFPLSLHKLEQPAKQTELLRMQRSNENSTEKTPYFPGKTRKTCHFCTPCNSDVQPLHSSSFLSAWKRITMALGIIKSVFLCHNDVLSTNKIKVLNSAVLWDGDFTSVND